MTPTGPQATIITATTTRSEWRGWRSPGAGEAEFVTSDPLGDRSTVRNRWFPKVRSWFALGAPLELLSPLSVARVIVLLGLIPSGALLAEGPGRILVLSSMAGLLAGLWALLQVRELHARGSELTAVACFAQVVLLVGASRLTPLGAATAVFLVPTALFCGLFLRFRRFVVIETVVAGALGAVMVAHGGWTTAVLAGLLAWLTVVATSLLLGLVTRGARQQGTVDPDTGIPNGFGLAREVAEWDGPFVLAAVVLRGMAEAREAFGYRVGTELLRRAVEDIGQVLPDGARLARVVGDELMVAQRLSSDHEASLEGPAIELIDAITSAIRSGRYLAGDVEVSLRPHVGYVLAPVDGNELNELIRRASLSARQALAAGDRHTRWSSESGTISAADLRMLAELRQAAALGQLWVAYQPQISTVDERVVSVEALLRWTRPGHGLVPPSVFIPLAERTGLIDRLTEWVLGESLDAQSRWRAEGIDLPVSVNFSALSLSDPELSGRVLGALEQRALPPSCLVVEVTEAVAVDVVHAVDHLRPLHEHGVRVSIDDFGTGYTSFSVLPYLPLDELKVDQRFVMAAPTSSADMAIVESIMELAHRLGLQAVAEGVETAEIAALMRSLGFDVLQGYHYARPLAEQDLLAFVAMHAETQRSSVA